MQSGRKLSKLKLEQEIIKDASLSLMHACFAVSIRKWLIDGLIYNKTHFRAAYESMSLSSTDNFLCLGSS